MKKLFLTTCAVLAMASTAHAFSAAPPKPAFVPTDGAALECAVVKLLPASAAGRDPVYKINVGLTYNDDGVFKGLDVFHTLVSGRSVNRSDQYTNGTTWTLPPKTKDWYWRGTRGTSTMVGHLYHNERDGWMYTEELFEHGRLTMQSTADCHEAKEGD